MKCRPLIAAALFAMPVAAVSAQITVEITEVPYTKPYAFLGVFFETGGAQKVMRMSDRAEFATPQTGFGLRMQSARDTDVQFEFQFAYRKLDLTGVLPSAQNIGLGSIHLGGRFYPRRPQFGLGNSIGVRVTGSAMGGYSYDFSDTTVTAGASGSAGGLDLALSAGLAFSGRTDPSGLMAEVVYRPSTLSGERFSVQPSWALRIGFVFGPG